MALGAQVADPLGNLVYRYAARNYAPTMAMAADLTIAQVAAVVPRGDLPPDQIITPGLFVDRIVTVPPAA